MEAPFGLGEGKDDEIRLLLNRKRPSWRYATGAEAL
jgi:hypothetical protein